MSKIIAANWKMNKCLGEASDTAKELAHAISTHKVKSDRTIMVFPPFLAISCVADVLGHLPKTLVGAQNCYPKPSGAFTGEVSCDMLKNAGATWVLTGHSERRHILGESDDFVAEKSRFALDSGLGVMLCVGETLAERESGQLREVLKRQIDTTLAKVSGCDLTHFAVAYEPVWAIGTGKVAGEAEVLEAHALVKELLGKFSTLSVLYGGSVKPSNAGSLLALANVDGLLVGGASLAAESFLQIINA